MPSGTTFTPLFRDCCIQRLLYKDPKDGGAFWIFKREGVTTLEVGEAEWGGAFVVREVFLYVLESGLGILKVELGIVVALVSLMGGLAFCYIRKRIG